MPTSNWTKHFKEILNLFLESNCPLCQRPTDQEFCLDCTRQLQRCQINHSSFLDTSVLGNVPIFAWGVYGGKLKRAIAALKYENQPQIARPLGRWLAEAWLTQGASRHIIVVPIPMHPNKLQQRGYNQAALLAESFCEITKLNLQANGLERSQETLAQFGLSALEREKNLAMAFQVGTAFRRQQPKYPVLLLDDIFTTGATAKSAISTLRQSGIKTYGLAALAIAQKPNFHPSKSTKS